MYPRTVQISLSIHSGQWERQKERDQERRKERRGRGYKKKKKELFSQHNGKQIFSINIIGNLLIKARSLSCKYVLLNTDTRGVFKMIYSEFSPETQRTEHSKLLPVFSMCAHTHTNVMMPKKKMQKSKMAVGGGLTNSRGKKGS